MIIKLPRPYPLQQDIKDSFKKHRFVVVSAGRRLGKTTLAIDLLITMCLNNNYDVAYFSISYKQLLAVFDRLCEVLEPIAKFDRANKRIKLPNNTTVTCWSLDSLNIADSVRGNKYGFVVVDEAAYVTGLLDIWGKVIRSTLVDLKGKALFISSPNGYNGFHKLYQEEKRNPYHWKSFRATSYDNPVLDKEELDELKVSLPERVYKTEILAHFLESNTSVFTNISSLFQPLEHTPKGITVIGIDFARSGDNTAMCVMRGDIVIDLLVYNDMSFDRQKKTVKELYRKYRPEVIIIESNGLSMPLVEELVNSDLPIEEFNTTNESKKIIIENLAVGIEQRFITVDKDLEYANQLADELAAYESKKTSTGKIVYNAPAGYNDDTVMAFALAYSIIRENNSSLVLWG